MRKHILFIAFLFLSTLISCAQTNENYTIYDKIVKMYKIKVPDSVTSFETFKDIDFKKLQDFDLSPKDTVNSEWKEFLNNVDTAVVQTGRLDSAFLAKYPRLPNTAHFIRFSPIILSADKTKALCGVHTFDSSSYAETMFLFERKNNDWTFRKFYLIQMQ